MPNDTKDNETREARNWLVDAASGHTWTQWPRYFNHLHLRYNTPHSLFVTLLYLWSAVTGVEWPEGQIALSQIPVEGRELRKWIEAFLAAKIFAMPYGPEPEGSQIGSTYEFLTTEPEHWNAFFDLAARLKAMGGLKDEIPAKEFGKMFAGIKAPKRKTPPGEKQFDVSQETERLANEIAGLLDRAAIRPKKYRKKASS